SNQLTLKIVNEIARNPSCAMDIARKLKQNEQKIYYHLRKLEQGGIIKLIGTEERYGMTAKIYTTVSPVISTKLYEDGHRIERKSRVNNNEMDDFLSPFIEKGKLNADIVFGAPYPHGEHEAMARDTFHFTDFALFLGRFIKTLNIYNYKLDVHMRKDDLKNNLILIGGPKINTIVNKINNDLPIYFDKDDNWSIKSTITGNSYHEEENGMIIRMKNPFNKNKQILIMAGIRSVGLRAAILAVINNLDEILKGNVQDSSVIAKVVMGIDKAGDGRIDTAKILE
ncbi:MAG: ArsR family transcriptional regulator, partial [Candidatus Aenigmatarchaeota archaeon]